LIAIGGSLLAAILFTRSSLALPPPQMRRGVAPTPIDGIRPEMPKRRAMTDQTQARPRRPGDMLEPVHVSGKNPVPVGIWTRYLVLFLRLMAAVWMVKGLYHWAAVCGVGAAAEGGFEAHTLAWQTATVLFAVLDLVAAVGLWLAAPWGAVVWLTSVVSVAAVDLFFPQIYGGSYLMALAVLGLLGIYLTLAVFAARERPA
jgi:hypothetical protein